ncbi:DUF1367 family protein [Sodalis sp. C49]|uniref:DUF1367 family protein n=1 Tax=Sodalis sp. C49 TaxID=3228929 RepID=UPI003965C344
MAQCFFMKSQGNILVPATPATENFIHLCIRSGEILSGDFKKARNPIFHRKYFSLLNLGFDYWEPTGGTISPVERRLVHGYIQYLAHYAGGEDALTAAADEYLASVSNKRSANISGVKSFEAFRHWVTVESGYYDAYKMPDGSVMKSPRSVSFAKMDETDFQALYKATLDTLWTFILHKTFGNQQAAENAASQLMSYAN